MPPKLLMITLVHTFVVLNVVRRSNGARTSMTAVGSFDIGLVTRLALTASSVATYIQKLSNVAQT